MANESQRWICPEAPMLNPPNILRCTPSASAKAPTPRPGQRALGDPISSRRRLFIEAIRSKARSPRAGSEHFRQQSRSQNSKRLCLDTACWVLQGNHRNANGREGPLSFQRERKSCWRLTCTLPRHPNFIFSSDLGSFTVSVNGLFLALIPQFGRCPHL